MNEERTKEAWRLCSINFHEKQQTKDKLCSPYIIERRCQDFSDSRLNLELILLEPSNTKTS
jgi:hypothetical protein